MRNQYSDFFEELNLSPEKQEKIIDILVNNRMASFEFRSDFQNATPSDEKTAEFAERRKALGEEAEATQDKIKDVLGNSDYERYQEYAETIQARSTVNKFVESLGGSDKPTEQQQKRLVAAIHEQLKAGYSKKNTEAGNEDAKFMSPSERETDYDAEEQMAKMWEYRDRRDEAYLRAAQDILSASQLESLKEHFQYEREKMQFLLKTLDVKAD